MALLFDNWVTELLQESHYLAPFIVLLLCGVGLPLPEEVTLIASGLLVHQGHADFAIISLVCSAAILLGDSAPYWLGRRYGLSALKIRWVRKVLHPERFSLLEERFAAHGNWAIFTCRFLPGVRIPGYFAAGTLKMPYLRFLLLDSLGVLISVPVSIYLGRLFAEKIETLQHRISNFHQILSFGVLSLVLILWVRSRTWKRDRDVVDSDEAPRALEKAQASRSRPPADESGAPRA